jgi:hypothetical protein
LGYGYFKYEAEKQRILADLSMARAVNFYAGLKPDRYGRLPCPIHHGANNNFKIYEKSFEGDAFYCFTCKAHGSVIDLVRQMFGLGYIEAMKKIDKDFGFRLFDKQAISDREFLLNYKRRKARENAKSNILKIRRKYVTMIKDAQAEYDGLFKDRQRLQSYAGDKSFKNIDEFDKYADDLYVYAVNELPRLEFEIDRAADRIQGIKERLKAEEQAENERLKAELERLERSERTEGGGNLKYGNT